MFVVCQRPLTRVGMLLQNFVFKALWLIGSDYSSQAARSVAFMHAGGGNGRWNSQAFLHRNYLGGSQSTNVCLSQHV